MIDKGPLPPCPVCCGAGRWDRLTGTPIFTKPPGPESTRCPLCEGTGVEPERSPQL